MTPLVFWLCAMAVAIFWETLYVFSGCKFDFTNVLAIAAYVGVSMVAVSSGVVAP